jgi:hypothetical protein
MAPLTTRGRKRMTSSKFAYIDSQGERHLPINDKAHVRNALARFDQTEFESTVARERARQRVLAAAKRMGVEVGKDDDILKPTSGTAD